MRSEKSPKGTKAPLPEFSSDRLRLLSGFLTDRAYALARRRVMEEGFRLVRRTKDHAGKETIERAEGEFHELKAALMLVHEWNPDENLNAEEEAIRRGADRKTVAKLRAREED